MYFFFHLKKHNRVKGKPGSIISFPYIFFCLTHLFWRHITRETCRESHWNTISSTVRYLTKIEFSRASGIFGLCRQILGYDGLWKLGGCHVEKNGYYFFIPSCILFLFLSISFFNSMTIVVVALPWFEV